MEHVDSRGVLDSQMNSTELRTRAAAEVEPPVRIELTTYRLQGG